MELSDKRPGRPRDEQLGARRTEEILDVAARLFAAWGFGNTDVQTVANQLGVGKGTIYRYFPTKQELFLAAVDRGMRRLMAHIEACMTDDDLLKQLEQAVRAYLSFFQANPEFVELLIQERAEFRDRPKPTYFAHRDANIGKFQTRLRSLIAEGRMRDLPLDTINNVVGDLVYGTMFTNYFSGRRRPLDQQADDILEVILTGLLSDKERHRRTSANASQPPRPSGDGGGNGPAERSEG
ncbi:MAG TPA: TetR/AcrR family transcriptional regulator [Phycisphaerae bacterium]|nr:TetR/AcrR family transcriptional regulator [Phycisphaerae bacterium]